MREKLAALYALQQQDSAIDVLKRQYAQLDLGKAEQQTLAAAEAARTEVDAALHAARAAVADTEMEQKSVEEKRVEYETRLYSGTINHPKELQAMQDEVDMLARNRDRLGEKLKSLLAELEDCRSRKAEATRAAHEADAASKEKQAAYKTTSEQIVSQARLLVGQRAEAAKQIDAGLLARYETLRKNKGGVAVVPVEDGNSMRRLQNGPVLLDGEATAVCGRHRDLRQLRPDFWCW